MNRFDARENAFALIFCSHFQKELTVNEILDLFLESQEIEKDDYFELLVQTAHANLEQIDAAIEQNLNNWSLQRISKVSLAALRLGVCEILYIEDTPDHVAINEAVELAKKYEDTKCGQFVNGVLSSVMKSK